MAREAPAAVAALSEALAALTARLDGLEPQAPPDVVDEALDEAVRALDRAARAALEGEGSA